VSADAKPVIEVEDVHVSFGEKHVLRGVNLSVTARETVALMGESGSGKTVLLRVILGLLAPDRGRVRLFGQDIAGLSDDDLLPTRKRMSVVYQGGALFSGMNVAENIALELREVLKLDREEVDARVKESLEAVGLGDVDPTTAPEELSGGMKKRLSVARAIAPRPEVVFYDEPTSGLDPINSSRILGLIAELRDRYHTTSVIVTHDVQGACGICDRIALLNEGVFAFDGPPAAFTASTEPVVATFRSLAAGPAAAAPAQ
jgi:phospholipid/cholesterol/gamma-HCH transport system ATP-binding protein